MEKHVLEEKDKGVKKEDAGKVDEGMRAEE